MRIKDDYEGRIIDEYYNEAPKSNLKDQEGFRHSMNDALTKMDAAKALDFPIDINLMDILLQGEKIRDKRKFRLELAGFISLSLLIISILIALLINIKPSIFIHIYGSISVLLPLVVLPIANNAKGEAEL